MVREVQLLIFDYRQNYTIGVDENQTQWLSWRKLSKRASQQVLKSRFNKLEDLDHTAKFNKNGSMQN